VRGHSYNPAGEDAPVARKSLPRNILVSNLFAQNILRGFNPIHSEQLACNQQPGHTHKKMWGDLT